MKQEVTMETKDSVSQIYIGDANIEIKKSIPMNDKEFNWGDGKGGSITLTINKRISRKILRWMTLGDRQHSRFIKQLVMLKYNPKHYEVILRCVRYRNKVPRKYMRMYKEVIKRIIITKNYGKDKDNFKLR